MEGKEGYIPKTAEELSRPASLKELYNLVIKTYPGIPHEEGVFLDAVLQVLREDPLRTRSLQSEVQDKGLELVLDKSWPLNDFLYATGKYLESRGVQGGESQLTKLVNG